MARRPAGGTAAGPTKTQRRNETRNPGHWMVRQDEVERWVATLSAPERFPEPEG